MEMSFLLEMDRPIDTDKHYIVPGGYCLRFTNRDGVSVDIWFDFREFSCYVERERFLSCRLSLLQDLVYLQAYKLPDLLSKFISPVWEEFFVFTGEESDAEINPVMVTNIVLTSDSRSFNLPDYKFNGNVQMLTGLQLQALKRSVSALRNLCVRIGILQQGSSLRFYNKDKDAVYLSSSTGSVLFQGVICENGTAKPVGVSCSEEELKKVKSCVSDAQKFLCGVFDFPIHSITIPYKQPIEGHIKPSNEERGSYDIIMR